MIKIQIIENNYKGEMDDSTKNTIEESIFPLKVECDMCGSIISIDKEDLHIGWLGAQHFTCPCCGEESMVDDLEGIKLTVNNLKFPEHFYQIGKSSLCEPCSDDEITNMIKECIEHFREHKNKFAVYHGRCDTMVHVYRFDSEKEYKIMVSKGYYDTDIPFEECDCREEDNK